MTDAGVPGTRAGRIAIQLRTLAAVAGAVLVGVIAADAAAHLVFRLVLGLTRLAEPGVLLGFMGLAIYIATAAVALLAADRLAVRGAAGARLAVLGGLVAVIIVRLFISVLADGIRDGEVNALDQIARAYLAGDCCFSDRPIGYPVALAAAYALLGVGPTAAEMLNLALGVASGLVLYEIVTMSAGRRSGVWSVALFALWPAGALQSNAGLSEPLYILLLLAAIALAARPLTLIAGVLLGAVLAAGHYVRPTNLALLPALLLAQLAHVQRLRQVVLPLAAVVVVALASLAPVVSYNLGAHGEASLSTSAYGGWSLYIGTDGRSNGRHNDDAAREIAALTPEGTWEDSKVAARIAIERITSNPAGFALLAVRKFDVLWGTEDYGAIYGLQRGTHDTPEMTVYALVTSAFYVAVAALAALALWRRRRDPHLVSTLIVMVIASVALIHVFVEVKDRYHAYVTPLLIALAAGELVRLVRGRVPARSSAASDS